MFRFAWAVCLFLVPFPASAQSIDLPATVKVAKPGAVVVVPEKIAADSVLWVVMTPGLEQLDPAIAKPAFGTFVGVAVAPGSYTVLVIAAKSINGAAVMSAPVVVTVVVGMGEEVKPGVNPGMKTPGSFEEKLAAAWQKETAVDAMKQAKELAVAFRVGAKLAVDPKLLTVGDFNLAFGKVSPAGQTIELVHAAIGEELAKIRAADKTALDEAMRATIAATFNKIAQAVEGLK